MGSYEQQHGARARRVASAALVGRLAAAIAALEVLADQGEAVDAGAAGGRHGDRRGSSLLADQGETVDLAR